jgi:hypothetical protein
VHPHPANFHRDATEIHASARLLRERWGLGFSSYSPVFYFFSLLFELLRQLDRRRFDIEVFSFFGEFQALLGMFPVYTFDVGIGAPQLPPSSMNSALHGSRHKPLFFHKKVGF